MNKFDIAILGGDKRTACMAPLFAQRGYRVTTFATFTDTSKGPVKEAACLREALENTPIIVCGIPFSKDDALYCERPISKINLSELTRLLRKRQRVYGGVIPEEFRHICEEREIGCFDFMKEETLQLYNAAATAEGAILEALLHKNTMLHQSKTLVLGFGRCGKILADKLQGLKAHVHICSSSPEERSLALAYGFCTFPLSNLKQRINEFEYLFNTIPACVLTDNCLRELSNNALVIDIASNKTGADYEAALRLKKQVLYCPGLPGKYAPLSCATKLTNYVISTSQL